MKEKETNSFKCPSCGTDMKHDQSSGTLSCEFCDIKEDICAVNGDVEEYDFSSDESDQSLNYWDTETKTLMCNSCGGMIVIPANETAATCTFCGSGDIMPTDELPGIKPESLIPFKIDENSAIYLFGSWIKKRKLAPFALKKEYKAGNIKGIYIPYWSYDSKSMSTYTGQAGDYYHDTEMRTVTINGKTETKPHRVQRIRWRFVSGTFDKKFDNIIYNDSSILDQKMIEKLEPYRLNELVKYDPKFLSGFAAERYNSGLKAVWERAKMHMSKTLRNEIRAIIKRGADVVGTVNICTSYTDIKYSHMLLPVWISSYQFKGKVYNFFVNGQTGEVQGSSPKSALKIGIIAAFLAAVGVALCFIL